MMVMPDDLGLACTGGRPEVGRRRKEKHKKKGKEDFTCKEEEWASARPILIGKLLIWSPKFSLL